MPELTSLSDLTGTPHAEVFDDGGDPRAVRLQLEADERIPEHRHPESNVVFQLLSGSLELSLDGEPYELESGDLVRFDGDQDISPHALEESTAVVVFASKPKS
ncbi:cupin domain-containing protein [Natronococcus sp. A-GB7]|uniref:cupin domain-containing protein n=1 Tax=Natronococcus sp. A-GB7 TaxID=3037649 RepID=UPI00241C7459|nr:cupin domain-containing protein [Natronococcus sp. A-GB7]MDG5821770.1 cupin domain-containing protein [Natronococcus sp. A-GB7]